MKFIKSNTDGLLSRLLRRDGRSLLLAGLVMAGSMVLSTPLFGQALPQPNGATQIDGGGPVNVEQLTERSTLIVRGIVASSEAKWVGRVIYTHYNLVVQETLKGGAQSSVTVAVLGGALGNVRLAVPGVPDLSTGEELVFFGQPLDGKSSFKPIGTVDGLVPVNRADGGSEGSEGTVAPSGRPENLEAFLDKVRGLSRSRQGNN